MKCPFTEQEMKAAGVGKGYDHRHCTTRRDHYRWVEEEQSARNYSRALSSCVPFCYNENPPPAADEVTVCGYNVYVIREPRIGKRFTGRYEANNTASDVVALDDCMFPKVPGKWKQVMKKASKAFPGLNRSDVLVPDDDAAWNVERNALGIVESRSLTVRVYAKDLKVRPKCGVKDLKAVCSFSGSRTAGNGDDVILHLQTANRLRGKEDTGAQISAWAALNEIRKAKQRRSSQDWIKGLRYVLMDGKTYSEDELFAWFAQREREALGIYRATGGPAQPPFDNDDR